MAKQLPNGESAERQKNKADQSNLVVNEFNKKLTHRNVVGGGCGQQDIQTDTKPPSFVPSLEMDLRVRKGTPR